VVKRFLSGKSVERDNHMTEFDNNQNVKMIRDRRTGTYGYRIKTPRRFRYTGPYAATGDEGLYPSGSAGRVPRGIGGATVVTTAPVSGAVLSGTMPYTGNYYNVYNYQHRSFYPQSLTIK
jgi:hypothetical protein